jgi:hypothetical protein
MKHLALRSKVCFSRPPDLKCPAHAFPIFPFKRRYATSKGRSSKAFKYPLYQPTEAELETLRQGGLSGARTSSGRHMLKLAATGSIMNYEMAGYSFEVYSLIRRKVC